MWYVASLCCLLLMLATLSLIGAAFAEWCLPWRLRPGAQEFLAPTLGLAVLLVPVAAWGWLGGGFRWWICLPVTVVAAMGGWWRRPRVDRRRTWRSVGFVVLASFPVLGQLLRYNAFNPFNDTWTYLYQAQWLQHHGFLRAATVADHHAPAAAVLGFQMSGLRIVPSMLVAWWQAVFGLEWSYQIYPAVLAAVLICGAMAVGATVLAVLPGRRQEAWWAALAAGVSVNGFVSGATSGFFPQTVGLTFGMAALALRAMEIATPSQAAGARGWRGWLEQGSEKLPLAACLAAAFYCYPEVCPFLGVAVATSYLFPWPMSWAQTYRRARALVLVGVVAGALVLPESGRALRAVRMQMEVVAGVPIAWTPGEFFGHTLGWRSGPYEGTTWVAKEGWTVAVAGIVPTVGFALLMGWAEYRRCGGRSRPEARPRRTVRWLALAPPTAMTVAGFAALLHFRWQVPNPWPNGVGPWPAGVGQTWSQYKLALWMSPAAMAVGAILLIRAAGWAGGRLAVWFLAAWCAVGIGWSNRLLLVRVNPLRLVSGETQDPFGSYRAFCETLSDRPASDQFYLEAVPGDFPSIKQREMLAYFLQDRPLLGNWATDDNLPAKYFAPDEGQTSVQDADWVVRYQPVDPTTSATDAVPRLCHLSVARTINTDWLLVVVAGGYDRERGEHGRWFYWTAHELRLTWRHFEPENRPNPAAKEPPKSLRLRCILRSFAANQNVDVQITGWAGETRTFTVPITQGETAYVSDAFSVSGDTVQVNFVGNGSAVRASASDPRELSYLVADASLEPAQL